MLYLKPYTVLKLNLFHLSNKKSVSSVWSQVRLKDASETLIFCELKYLPESRQKNMREESEIPGTMLWPFMITKHFV